MAGASAPFGCQTAAEEQTASARRTKPATTEIFQDRALVMRHLWAPFRRSRGASCRASLTVPTSSVRLTCTGVDRIILHLRTNAKRRDSTDPKCRKGQRLV